MCKECLPANRAAGVRKKATEEAQDFLLMCHLLFIKGVNLPKSCLLNCDIWERGLNKQVYDLFLIQQVVKNYTNCVCNKYPWNILHFKLSHKKH